jgi:hypothetical protein
LAGCGSGDDGGSSGPDGGDNNNNGNQSPYAAAHQDCVDRINAFRATENKPALTRWTEGEACANDQARRDALSGVGHANFGDCGEFAQNTCPNWRDLDSVIQGCLQGMWDEGPGPYNEGHGHYLNMSSTQYTQVACGFHQGSDGIWASQNFR